MVEDIKLILSLQSALRDNDLYVNTATATAIVKNLKESGIRIPVRCKDCKHYKPQNKVPSHHGTVNYCKRVVTLKMPPEGFCCYGERREEQ